MSKKIDEEDAGFFGVDGSADGPKGNDADPTSEEVDAVLDALPLVGDAPDDGGDWTTHLTWAVTADNRLTKLAKTIRNADLVVNYHEAISGAFAMNELDGVKWLLRPVPNTSASCDPRIAWDRAPTDMTGFPRPLQDSDVTALRVWMEGRWGYAPGKDEMYDLILRAAQKNSYSPVVDYLRGLRWDGEPRIERVFSDWCGATDPASAAMIGRWWMISAVARAFAPGCQVDHMLVLEGDQGIGKSSALRALFGEWHREHMPDPRSREAGLSIQGAWCIEASELDALKRSELTAIKSFLTQTKDVYRAPYARESVTRPRRCVFAATTNERTWIHDRTGGRRFWPVRCTEVALDEIVLHRDQIWAEAVALYLAGEKWWPQTEDRRETLRALQDDRTSHEDPWQATVHEWLETPTVTGHRRDEVTMDEILSALKVDVDRRSHGDAIRVGTIMTHIPGWERIRIRDHGARVRVWRRSTPF